MKCPVCQVNEAIVDDYYGYLACQPCQDRQAKLKRPGTKIPEFAGESIRKGRKMHSEDIHPAHRKGVASREFREAFGEKAMERQGFTKKEIKEAKYVWAGDDSYYKKGN